MHFIYRPLHASPEHARRLLRQALERFALILLRFKDADRSLECSELSVGPYIHRTIYRRHFIRWRCNSPDSEEKRRAIVAAQRWRRGAPNFKGPSDSAVGFDKRAITRSARLGELL